MCESGCDADGGSCLDGAHKTILNTQDIYKEIPLTKYKPVHVLKFMKKNLRDAICYIHHKHADKAFSQLKGKE